MLCHVHHVHLFASDINKSVKFYEDYFGGKVILDSELAGARNVFMKIGKGRLHFYDQPAKNSGKGSIHHFGIQTDEIEKVVNKLIAGGIALRKEVTDLGFWKYVMVPAPDDILIELFQVDTSRLPPSFDEYFD